MNRFKKHSFIPLFALGMGYQVQTTSPSFFQATPSAEEIPYDVIAERHDVNPAEALKSLPGVVILGSEVTTSPSALLMRGSDADHTLFIWNDIRADSFTSPTGSTDPFSFGNEFSNRLRVLKGPQSLMYGTQALGGVVLVDQDPDLPSNLELATGSLGTAKGLGEVRTRGQKWQLGLGASAFTTEGVSSYNAPVPAGANSQLETDGRSKSSGSMIFSYDLPNEDQLQILVNLNQEKTSFDVPPKDDVNAQTENRGSQWKVKYDTHWTDTAESSFLLTGQDTNRESRNPVDALNSDFFTDLSSGQRQGFLNRNSFLMGGSLWHLGAEYNQEQGSFSYVSNTLPLARFSPSSNDESLYLVNDQSFATSDVSWGLRGNCQESKDCRGVYQISYQHHWPTAQRTLYGIVSTGLKRPTMYQLYSSYGDPALHAETSQAFEMGLVQRWQTQQTFKMSLFENRFSDLIDYDFTANKSKNVKQAKAQGLELMHKYETVFWDHQLSVSQIYSKNENTGQYLLRRPVHQAAWNFGSLFWESFRATNELVYVGQREDVDINGQRLNVNAVLLWNAVFNYKGVWANYFFRVNNIANTTYEDIAGYKTPGRFFWTGIKTSF